MAGKTRKHNITGALLFIVLESVSLYVLFSGNEARQFGVGRLFTQLQGNIWGTLDSWGRYFSLKEENGRLAQENFDLAEKLFEIDCGQEQKTLVRGKFSYLQATIATMTLNSRHNYMILDRGEKDGVEINDGVITSRGVVGLVAAVSSGFSYAITSNNPGMVLSARVGHDGSVGTLRWDGGTCTSSKLSDIPLHSHLEKGDTIYTSGFSPFFPGEIPIGVVKDKKVDGGSSYSAAVENFEDFSYLRYVIIVKNLNRNEIENLSIRKTDDEK